jgi:nucleotide-binding universal stress UspA family protein
VEQEFGWKIRPETAATEVVHEYSPTLEHMIARVGEKLYDVLTPDELASGPAPGAWQREALADRREDHLFPDILVPVSGKERGWWALDQAIEVARGEEGYVHGLHIVSSDHLKHSTAAFAVNAEFDRRCQAAGITGNLAIEVGDIPRKICERARWTDLVVIPLVNPPGRGPLARLESPFRTIVLRSPRPILTVPTMATKMDRALLAYDGSPKANEALFLISCLCCCISRVLRLLLPSTAKQTGTGPCLSDCGRRAWRMPLRPRCIKVPHFPIIPASLSFGSY